MKLVYTCTNGPCLQTNAHPQRLDLPSELVMDEKNIAVIYCPKCKSPLKRIK